MKGSQLGEFEEIILLLIAVMQEDAYGLAIQERFQEQTGRSAAIGAVHSALNRLEEKGFVESQLAEATAERGGRRKRIFSMTLAGKNALQVSKDLRNNLWDQIPDYGFEGLKAVLLWR
ncbi:PadR family transcriptional regulator [Marinoscillum pacificum]|uniref:PadR family transcriptional regulator n=1 Tax=Marinoscillum pacificum TaxID=392723 RepID=UPI0021588B08|nr:PadR family transcriptional regulator [Marinoscillum pacificum]